MYVMKAHGGRRFIVPLSFGVGWRWVVSFTPQPH